MCIFFTKYGSYLCTHCMYISHKIKHIFVNFHEICAHFSQNIIHIYVHIGCTFHIKLDTFSSIYIKYVQIVLCFFTRHEPYFLNKFYIYMDMFWAQHVHIPGTKVSSISMHICTQFQQKADGPFSGQNFLCFSTSKIDVHWWHLFQSEN